MDCLNVLLLFWLQVRLLTKSEKGYVGHRKSEEACPGDAAFVKSKQENKRTHVEHAIGVWVSPKSAVK